MKKKFPKQAIEAILSAYKAGLISAVSATNAIHELFDLYCNDDDITLDGSNQADA